MYLVKWIMGEHLVPRHELKPFSNIKGNIIWNGPIFEILTIDFDAEIDSRVISLEFVENVH